MHNRKLFFADLDGTLLTDEKKISPKTMDALHAFTAAGHIFSICTGRPLPSAKKVAADYHLYDLPGLHIVAFNGAEILDVQTNEIISRFALPLATAQLVYDEAKRFGLYCQTYADTHIITRASHESLAYYTRNVVMPARFADDLSGILEKDPCKCLVIELSDHALLERFRLHLRDILDDSVTTLYSGPHYLEVFPTAAGKGHALTLLAAHLSIAPENTFAAGDAENDISMIRAAACGIAMKNAEEAVRLAANVVTETDNNHDGLVPFLAP